MSDELPTEERLRRIERGVQRRIGRRRLVGQRIAVAAVAVVVVAGGFALIRPVIGGGASTSAAGRVATLRNAPAAAPVPVECHGTRTVTVQADGSGLPASALAACARTEHVAAGRPVDGAASGASATPSTRTLCRATDGALHVYPGAAGVCATHRMTPYPG